MIVRNKTIVLVILCAAALFGESHARLRDKKDEVTAHNLRVIPRNISHEELISIMRKVSRSLGVKCSYCHVEKVGELNAEGHPVTDFASDDKEQKRIARKMMRMTKDINERLDDMGDHQFEKVDCITCHRGFTQPSFTLDSAQKSWVK